MKELILLGRGPSWKECPYDAEVWAISTILLDPTAKISHISKVFAFDPPSLRDIMPSVKKAKEHSIPVISTKQYATEPYPLEEICSHFNTAYMRNSISFMLAMAIYQKYELIRLYGIDQGPQWDYISTKPYVTFWLGVALGRGIEFQIANSSILLEPHIKEIKANIRRIGKVKDATYRLRVLPQLNILPEVSVKCVK